MRNLILSVFFLSFLLSGCGGLRTFSAIAQSGSTVSVPAGWRQGFTRDNISMTITDSAMVQTVYPVGDSRIRAVSNIYPDPVSSLVVDYRAGDPGNVGVTINDYQTDQDDDWWQTIVIFDLPTGMATGTATVQIDGPNAESYGPVDVEIVAGAGTPDPMQAKFSFGNLTLTPGFLAIMDRPAHYAMNFVTTGTIPYAIEVNLTHDPDETVGGSGHALAINPRGDNTSMNWNDDGNNMRVIMMRANDTVVDNIKDFKFYVSGGITSLALGTVTAYDQYGVVVPGVSPSCTFTGC